MLPRPFSNRDRIRQAVAWTVGPLVAFALMLGFVVDAHGGYDEARPSGALVVLGGRVLAGGKPSAALLRRVGHACELWQRGLAPKIVMTGGRDGGGLSQAEAARTIALARGLPPDVFLLDEHSRNTAENVREAAKLMRGAGLPSAIVVSDGYHLLRARQLFRREGLEVATSPSEPESSGLSRLYWTSREVAALMASPWLLVTKPPQVR